MSAHELPYELTQAPFETIDPGTGAALVVDRYNQVIPLTIAASASETNTLAAPLSAGQRVRIFAASVGVSGSRTITVASAVNQDGDLTLVFDAVDEFVVLESFPVGSGVYEWRVTAAEGASGGAATDLVVDGLSVGGNAAVTGNGTVGGTLGVTGATTLVGAVSAGTAANAADRAAVIGRYLSGVVAVTVPAIANDAAENIDSVDVDVSAMTFAPAVGDSVIAIPQEALPTDCLLLGASVTATDTVRVVFGSKEGGGGVSSSAKNFKFLFDDLT